MRVNHKRGQMFDASTKRTQPFKILGPNRRLFPFNTGCYVFWMQIIQYMHWIREWLIYIFFFCSSVRVSLIRFQICIFIVIPIMMVFVCVFFSPLFYVYVVFSLLLLTQYSIESINFTTTTRLSMNFLKWISNVDIFVHPFLVMIALKIGRYSVWAVQIFFFFFWVDVWARGNDDLEYYCFRSSLI